METTLKPKPAKIKDEVEYFILNWTDFPFDYWWRKKYNIPFGSQTHREMNFIDMYIEYREELLFKKMSEEANMAEEELENKALGIENSKTEKMTKKEIDTEYENLDLSQFDK